LIGSVLQGAAAFVLGAVVPSAQQDQVGKVGGAAGGTAGPVFSASC